MYSIHKMQRLLPVVFIIVLSSCAGLEEYSSRLSKSQYSVVIDVARERVLASKLVNGQSEIELIKNNEPKLSYYFLAKPYADYFISWQLNDEEHILVRGMGDILKLEGATISRNKSK